MYVCVGVCVCVYHLACVQMHTGSQGATRRGAMCALVFVVEACFVHANNEKKSSNTFTLNHTPFLAR